MYTTRQVSELLNLPAEQVRRYARTGFLSPGRDDRGRYQFAFQDLVLLRSAAALASEALSHRQLRRALRCLKAQVKRNTPLTAVQLAVEPGRVIASDGTDVWEPESGQMHLPFGAERAEDVPVQRYDERLRIAQADQAYKEGCALEGETPNEAKRAYRRALDKNPGHVDARVNLGRLLHREGRLEEAVDHYRLALTDDPSHATAAYNLGVALQDCDRFDEAISAYQRALDLAPMLADAHYNLACAYEQSGDVVGALRHLKAYRTLKGRN